MSRITSAIKLLIGCVGLVFSLPLAAAVCPTGSNMITSTPAGGNASNPATWGGTSIGDGNGVCLMIQGPIVLDQDLGAKGGQGVFSIIQSGAGALSTDSSSPRHIYFASTGNNPMGSGDYFNPGADANMYGFVFPSGSLSLTGTQANPVLIDSADGVHPWYIAGSHSETQSFSLTIKWCDCYDLGTNVKGYEGASVDTSGFKGSEVIDIENTRFTNPYQVLNVFAGGLAAGQFRFLNNLIAGRQGPSSVQASSLASPIIQDNTETGPAAMGWLTSVNSITGPAIAYTRNVISGTALAAVGNLVVNATLAGGGVITNNGSYNDPAQTGGAQASGIDITSNAVFTGAIDSNLCETCTQALAIRGTATTSLVTLTNNFAVANHLAAPGQGLYFLSGGNINMTGNLGIFTDANNTPASANCIFAYSTRSILTATNNTCVNLGGPASYSLGIHIGEIGFPVSGAVVSYNLVSGYQYGVFDNESQNQYADSFAGVGVHHNDVWNASIAYQPGGSPRFDNGTQPHPSSIYGDLTLDPAFVDPTRISLAGYDSSVLGGPGTVSDFITQLSYRSGWGGTYHLGTNPVGDALSWFRAGFTPSNTALCPSGTLTGAVPCAGTALTLTPTTLPAAVQGANYSQTLAVTNGTNCNFTSVGSLPAGISLTSTGNSNMGSISGIPTALGSYSFTILAVCTNGSASQSTVISVGIPSPQTDVTSQITFTESRVTYGAANDLRVVILTNTSSTPITAPLQFVFSNLVSGVSILNPGGIVPSGTYAGSPYITSPTSTSLGPGESTVFVVLFANPTAAPLSYVPAALSGAFSANVVASERDIRNEPVSRPAAIGFRR